MPQPARRPPASAARRRVATPGEPVAAKLRLPPDERRRLIVEAAADYFAEHGFEGGTTELARRIGVSQPLLFRYFPTKQELIENVCEHAFPSTRYYGRWIAELDERDVPLRDRLVRFYSDYAEALLHPKFLRLAIWARMGGTELGSKYTDALVRFIFPRIVRALKEEAGLDASRAPTAGEIELVQSLHGSIYYVAVRRMHDWLPQDVRDIVISKIDVFLDGARHAVKNARPAARARRG